MTRLGRGGWGGVALLFAACGGSIDLKTDAGAGGSPAASAGEESSQSAGRGGKGSASGGVASSGTSALAGKSALGAQGGESGLGDAGESSSAGTSSSAGAGNESTHALPVLKSLGCGKPLPSEQISTVAGTRTGYTEWHVTQTGSTLGTAEPANAGARQFFVRVPPNYDPERPYRVVYIGQGCGAQHAGKTNTYPLFDEAQGGNEQAVYVGLSVPDNAVNPGCYDNNTGVQSQEWEAFDLIHTFVEKTYCVDNNRIYAAGYSTGGWVANMWGCYFAGTPSPPLDEPDLTAGRQQRKFAPHWAIRGHLATAAALPANQPQACNGPSAGFWLHDAGDQSTQLAMDVAALDLSLKTNGCKGDYASGPKQPWAPAEQIPELAGGICQQYTGCSAEMNAKYPLVFCTTTGNGHSDQAAQAVPAFTRFMDLLEPAP